MRCVIDQLVTESSTSRQHQQILMKRWRMQQAFPKKYFVLKGFLCVIQKQDKTHTNPGP
jgi:hypothetical protein